jgi:hypothetical protein
MPATLHPRWGYPVPERPGGLLDDRLIVAHATVTAPHPIGVAYAIAARPQASPELVAATLERALAVHGMEAAGVIHAAHANPQLADTLADAAIDTICGGTLAGQPNRPSGVLHHPRAADRVEEIVASGVLTPSDWRALLGNHHLDAAFLEQHWEQEPGRALRNPRLDSATLETILDAHPDLAREAAAHPHIGADTIERCLRRGERGGRSIALRNPRLTDAELSVELRAERLGASVSGGPPTISLQVLWERLGVVDPDDPLDVPARHLNGLALNIRADVAALFADLDGDALAAAARLRANHFDGTVGELISVAAALTA